MSAASLHSLPPLKRQATQASEFLIGNSAIRSSANAFTMSNLEFSNRRRIAPFGRGLHAQKRDSNER
jgi:hypothetical protein